MGYAKTRKEQRKSVSRKRKNYESRLQGKIKNVETGSKRIKGGAVK